MSPLSIIETNFVDSNFIDFYNDWHADIKAFFPDFSEKSIETDNIYLLEYAGIIAGLLVYVKQGKKLIVKVDYMIPEFRDMGIGPLFFNKKIEHFREDGIKKIETSTFHPDHKNYLLEIGFKPVKNSEGLFEMKF